MALIVTIPNTTFTDPGVSPLRVDPMLVYGSLWLVDPTYPGDAWGSGVPATGAAINNVAADAAAELTGSAPSALDLTFNKQNQLTGVNGGVERTSKGGLHGYIQQSTTPNAYMSAGVWLPAALEAYLEANLTHTLYFSMWHRITRTVDPSQTRGPFAHINYGDPDSTLMAMTQQQDYPLAAPELEGKTTTNQGSLGASFRAIATNDITGSFTGLNDKKPWVVGRWGPFTDSIGTLYSPSHILYRIYAEDLTVSGRTYAQVAAIDQQEYTREVLTAGGRYYGDTFSDPATVAP